MTMDVAQAELFEARDAFPRGFAHKPDFITRGEEAALLTEFANLPFGEAHFQQYTARRRVVRYGEGDYPASYGKEAEKANPRRPFPDFLPSASRSRARRACVFAPMPRSRTAMQRSRSS